MANWVGHKRLAASLTICSAVSRGAAVQGKPALDACPPCQPASLMLQTTAGLITRSWLLACRFGLCGGQGGRRGGGGRGGVRATFDTAGPALGGAGRNTAL